ncbi:MAG: cell filamentation protein Fic [Flavobacteriales bacterium]|nr:cell filamentation protein Fic [Flavobacteriales bacterium]
MELIGEDKNITIPVIAELLNKTPRTIEMAIAKLKERGKLERIGPDKGGYWEVK